MRKNPDDGRLTKMDALMAIAKEADCAIDEILEDTPAEPVNVGNDQRLK